MTPESLKAWRLRLRPEALHSQPGKPRRRHVTIKAASEELGIGRHTYERFEAGTAKLPRWLGLACASIAHGLKPME